MRREIENNLWPSFSRVSHPLYEDTCVTFAKGKGVYLYDTNGKCYFDGFSTLWTNLIGHGREDVIGPMIEQMRKLSFMHLFGGSQHEPALRLSKKLIESSPFNYKYCFYGCSGSDATETAVKIARSYWYCNGKREKNIVVGRGSEYHGTSLGALSLMGSPFYKTPYLPLVSNIAILPPPNCYRCPFGREIRSCHLECYYVFENYFEEIDARNNVAAILIEPIITSDGLIVAPDNYWEHLQALCKEHDVLLIADEVSTGMGRCGQMLASSLCGIKPDILYLAKSLTSGYAPLSATLVSEKIYNGVNSNDNYFTHGTTFAGHPVACTAAESVIDILKKDDLIFKSKNVSKILEKTIFDELSDLNNVGNIRGRGMLYEVELVADKKNKTVPRDEVELSMRLFSELLKQNVYLRVIGRFICIAPPLIATGSDCINMCNVLRRAINRIAEIRSIW